MNVEEFERMFAAKRSDAELTEEEREEIMRDKIPLKANEMQVAGDHYKKLKVQPWDVIDATFSHAEAKGFYRGNAIKYIMRAGTKGPAREDYEKAMHYLQKLLEVL